MKLNQKQQGFTLIELLIVLAILVVIFALVMPSIWKRWEKAKKEEAKNWISKFEVALEDYRMDIGSYPTTNQGLEALILKPQQDMTGGMNQLQQSGQNPMNQQQNGQSMMPGNTMPGGGMDNNSMMPNNPQGGNSQFPNSPMPNNPQSGNPQQYPGSGFAPQGQTGMPGPASMPGDQNLINSPNTMNPSTMNPGSNSGMMPMGNNNMGNNNSGMDGNAPGMPSTFGNSSSQGPATFNSQPGSFGAPSNYGNSGSSDTAASASALTNWDGGYLGKAEKIPLDPWKKTYHYEYPTNKTTDGRPAIWSEGPDGKENTDDDICNFDLATTQLFQQRNQPANQGNSNNGQMDSMNSMNPQGGMGGTGMGGTGMGGTGMGGAGMGGAGMNGAGMNGAPRTQQPNGGF